MAASSAPRLGAVEMRQSGCSSCRAERFDRSAAKGATSRTAAHKARDAGASSVASSPNGCISASSMRLRSATEGEKPSSRSAVTASAAMSPASTRTATPAGRCAAPDTSQEEPIALVMASIARAGSRPRTTSVCSVSGRGSTLIVTSVIAGSWGTLAAMTEVTIKVLPRPETEQTLVVRGLEPARAIEAMTGAMGSSCDVSGATHLPADVVTALRLEGFSPSVAERKRMLEALMQPFGALATLEAPASRALWAAVRDVAPFAADRSNRSARQDEQPLWRISTAPSRGAELAGMIASAAQAQMFYDWAGGLIWVRLGACDDAGAALVQRAVAATGGHATLARAPASVRAAIDVFAPQDAAVAALTKRVKESFDPRGVLNPGRMWAGV